MSTCVTEQRHYKFSTFLLGVGGGGGDFQGPPLYETLVFIIIEGIVQAIHIINNLE